MQANNEDKHFLLSFLPIVSGVMSALGTAFLLLPLVKYIFSKFFDFYLFAAPPSEEWRGNFTIQATLFGWFFISSLVGGFFCMIVSRNRDIIQVLVSSTVSIGLFMIVTKTDLSFERLFTWLLVLAIPLGNFVGAWLASGYKKKG